MEKIGNSLFLKTFGFSPVNKVMDFLIVFDNFDYSMMDISEKANISYSTLKTLIPQLLKRKIIIQTRTTGKSSMYKINKKNKIVQSFIKFYWEITNKIIGKQVKGQAISA